MTLFFMEEIINKFNEYPPEEQQRIENKYKTTLPIYYTNVSVEELKYLYYCLEFSFKYLNENHKEETKEIKAWSTVSLIRKLKNKTINSEEDIIEVITKTIEHFKKEEYSIYLSDIAMFNNEYVRDHEYLNKLII